MSFVLFVGEFCLAGLFQGIDLDAAVGGHYSHQGAAAVYVG